MRSSALACALFVALASAARAQTAADARRRAQAVLGGSGAPEAPAVAEPASAAAPAAAAPAPRAVDLNSQFYDHERDQGDIGSCHAFASVALIEAAWQRSKGSCVRLSEADLFLRRTVMGWNCGADCGGNQEGNFVNEDIDYALHNGVLPGSTYSEFARSYGAWRKSRFPASSDPLPEAEKSYLDRYLLDPIGMSRKAVYPPEVIRSALTDFQREEDARVLLRARDAVKNGLAGFRLSSRGFTGAAAGCEKNAPFGAGDKQLAALSSELDAGRPVAVSMIISGLKAWGTADVQDPSAHAFLIIGYRDEGSKGDAGRVFKTRNSWQDKSGAMNPDVPRFLACRIFRIDSLLAPGEKAKF